MRAGHDVGDNFSVLRIGDARLENTDHRRRPIAEASKAYRFPQNGRIFLERRRPEAIREDDRAGRVGAIVLRSDQTTKNGMKSHDIEVGAADHTGPDLTRLSQADHGEADRGEVPKRAQALHAGTEILNLRHAKIRIFGADAGGALPHIDQSVFVAVDQRLEQNAAHQCEDGGIGADPESERQNDGERHPGRPPERVKSNSHIANE